MSDLLNQASLVMVPSGYKEDTVYSVVPSDGSGDLSFTRASNGTRINSAGLVEVVPWNLLQYSEDFANAYWAKYNLTITSNSITAPNGTLTADTMLSTNATIVQIIEGVAALTNGETTTITIYAKYKDTAFLQILVPSFVSTEYVNFNIQTGVISDGSYTTASIESVGNGWYRCQFAYTSAYSGTTVAISNSLVDSGTASRGATFTGNGVKGIYLWGAQLNIGSTAKPYFPTTDRLNVPRLTYQNGGGGCPSLLLEKQSTNLILQSEDFTSASWGVFTSGSGTTNRIANAAISPDGTQNADEIQLTRTALTQDALLFQQQYAANATYSRTIYLKAARSQDVGKKVDLWSYDGSSTLNRVHATLTADWQRFDAGTSTGALVEILSFGYLSSSAFPTTSGTDVRFYAWGIQGEASSYPTSYIPTTSSSATRVADVCSKTGISSLIGQTEGVLFIDVQNLINANTFNIVMGVSNSAVSEFFLIYLRNNGKMRYYYGVNYFEETTNLPNGRHKFAIGYSGTEAVIYRDGVQIAAVNDFSKTTTYEKISLGYLDDVNYVLGTGVNQAALFPTRLTNAELASLTTI